MANLAARFKSSSCRKENALTKVLSSMTLQKTDPSDVGSYRRVHAHSYIIDNQGKMEGNSKICIGIQSPLILPEFIYLMLSL